MSAAVARRAGVQTAREDRQAVVGSGTAVLLTAAAAPVPVPSLPSTCRPCSRETLTGQPQRPAASTHLHVCGDGHLLQRRRRLGRRQQLALELRGGGGGRGGRSRGQRRCERMHAHLALLLCLLCTCGWVHVRWRHRRQAMAPTCLWHQHSQRPPRPATSKHASKPPRLLPGPTCAAVCSSSAEASPALGLPARRGNTTRLACRGGGGGGRRGR